MGSERDVRRSEWLRLMVELGSRDRDAYRRLRSEAWDRVAAGHKEKSPEEHAAWIDSSS